jgi:hypothetical protein
MVVPPFFYFPRVFFAFAQETRIETNVKNGICKERIEDISFPSPLRTRRASGFSGKNRPSMEALSFYLYENRRPGIRRSPLFWKPGQRRSSGKLLSRISLCVCGNAFDM